MCFFFFLFVFFVQAEDGIRDLVRSRGLGDVYKRQTQSSVRKILDALEASPERRERFLASLSALLAETDGTALFGDVGIPGDRGFLSELGDRISARLIPVSYTHLTLPTSDLG